MTMPLTAQGSHHRHRVLKHSANRPVRMTLSRSDRFWLRQTPLMAVLLVTVSYLSGMPGTTETAIVLTGLLGTALGMRLMRHTGSKHRSTRRKSVPEKTTETGILEPTAFVKEVPDRDDTGGDHEDHG